MSAFKLIEGEYAIVSMSGTFKQVPLAERNGLLYAAVGGGYVQLRHDGSTSKDKLRLDEMSWEGTLAMNRFGKLCRPEVDGAKVLAAGVAQLLLGTPE